MSAVPAHARPARTTAPQRSPHAGARRQEGRPDLRVVPRRRRPGRYLAAMAAIGAVGVFGIVSLSALAAESAFAARALEAEIDDLSFRYDELTAEVASLESPARVRRVATEELGMVPAAQPAYLIADRSAPGPAPGTILVPASADAHDPVKQALGSGG